MKVIFAFSVLLHISVKEAQSSRTKFYSFPGRLCSYPPKEVDAVQLTSSYDMLYANTGCSATLKADGSGIFNTARFMIYFEIFSITECGTTLKIYSARNSYATPDVTLDCRSPKPSVMYSRSRYLTIRIDKATTTGYAFKIILTAFKQSCSYKDLRCYDNTTSSTRCFDNDVRCDSVRNCPDGSDERNCYYTRGHGHSRRGMSRGTVAGSVIAVLFVAIVGCVIGVYCYRRRRTYNQEMIVTTQQSLPPKNYTQQTYPSYDASQMAAPPPFGAYSQPGAPQYPPAYPASAQAPGQYYPGYPPPTAGYGDQRNEPYPPPPPGSGVGYHAASQHVIIQ